MPPRPRLRTGLLCHSVSTCTSRAETLLAPRLTPTTSATTRTLSVSAPTCDSTDKTTPSSSPFTRKPTEKMPGDVNKVQATASGGLVDPQLPPESPHYIHLPKPPQSEDLVRPVVRGHLPVPRDVFVVSRKPGEQFATETKVPKSDVATFAARAARRSQAEERGDAPRSAQEAWRRVMADSRRQSLVTGLAGLWDRRQTRTQRERVRAQAVATRHRRAALERPERADEVLTRSSVRDSTARMTAVLRDPLRHEKQAASAARTASTVQQKRDNRREALLQLYHSAGDFIVDEEELQKTVEGLFRADYFMEEGYTHGSVNAKNIWDVAGKQATVQDMLRGVMRTETRLYDSKRTEADRTAQRQKLVAETLTGGKMPV